MILRKYVYLLIINKKPKNRFGVYARYYRVTFYPWKKKFSKDTHMSGKADYAPIKIVPSGNGLFAEGG